jgi:hypothetical protein
VFRFFRFRGDLKRTPVLRERSEQAKPAANMPPTQLRSFAALFAKSP